MMKVIQNIDLVLRRIEEGLLISLVVLMVFLAFFQVVLRNLFAAGIIWADIFLRHLVLWIGLLGAVVVTSEKRHIKIDIFSKLIPERARPLTDLFIDVISFFVTVLLTKASFTFVMAEKMGGSILFLKVPAWTMELIIPIGFALIAFHFLLRIFVSIYGIVNREDR